jgi:hypothetical protein
VAIAEARAQTRAAARRPSVNIRPSSTRDDLGAVPRMTGEYGAVEQQVVTQHVKARRGDECTEATDEVEWVEQHGAVFPRALESNANAAVRVRLQPIKGERRSGDVAAQALETQAARDRPPRRRRGC